MPWFWAEQVSDNAIYWGWRIRTQDMGWISDKPTNRARFCIYSTNGFHVRESERGRRELLPLECPPRGTRVVTDLSALITLHRLGLLDAAAEYFGEILVPAGYLPTVLEESREMVLKQRSQKESAEQIAKKVHAGHILMLAKPAESLPRIAEADEYAESEEHRYRLRDLMQPLYEAGVINDSELARVSRVCAKPSAVAATHPALSQFQEVMVDLTTLETVANIGLLDAVAGFFKICISVQAHLDVRQRLNDIAYREETRGWHMDLWNCLRHDNRFRFAPHTVPEKLQVKDPGTKDYLPFLASFVAQETKAPLMADDRVCQALRLNESLGVPQPAFGTDVLVPALLANGKLDLVNAADVFRRLMAWRYRFIVPPPEVLKTLADAHRGNLPGQSLRGVAEYVQDCMRDPGLFGGPEKTDMGDSMAVRSYLTWISNVSEFLVLVWADKSFPSDAAFRLTAWSCAEFLPSLPRVLEGRMRSRLADVMPRMLLSNALLKMANYPGEPRMADAMKAIREGLRLDKDAYMRIVTETLNDTARARA